MALNIHIERRVRDWYPLHGASPEEMPADVREVLADWLLAGPASARLEILTEIADECVMAELKHGKELQLPMGTGLEDSASLAEACKLETDTAQSDGSLTWAHILTEEWAEALAESDPLLLRDELKQVAGVCVHMIEAIDNWEPVKVWPYDGAPARLIPNDVRPESFGVLKVVRYADGEPASWELEISEVDGQSDLWIPLDSLAEVEQITPPARVISEVNIAEAPDE